MLKLIRKRFSDLEKMMNKGVHKLERVNKPMPKRESLLLYREVLKFSKEFDWVDELGREWGEKIRKSAREEFELARYERDPFIIGQMLITSKEAIEKVREKLIIKYDSQKKELLEGRFLFKEDRERLSGKKQGTREKEMNFYTYEDKRIY